MTSSKTEEIKNDCTYLIQVSGTIYGPISADRVVADFLEGKLSSSCLISPYFTPCCRSLEPCSCESATSEEQQDSWTPLEESNLIKNITKERKHPKMNNRWQTIDNPQNYIFIFGDYLVLESRATSFWDNLKSFFTEPSTGAIPFPAILNISFSNKKNGVEIEACIFKERMYEVHSLKCTISNSDARELRKELQKERIRIIDA